jgi:hypothetical protein
MWGEGEWQGANANDESPDFVASAPMVGGLDAFSDFAEGGFGRRLQRFLRRGGR